jgi:hypothetical protein
VISVAEQNYQAKLEARRTGKTPVLVTPPAAPGEGDAEGRYRAKLAARLATPPIVVADPPAPAQPAPVDEPAAKPAVPAPDAGEAAAKSSHEDRRQGRRER